jgi:predicted nucleic acid-binding protein
MIVVSDTSPITSLIHIGRLSLLRDIYGVVLVLEAEAVKLGVFFEAGE